MAQALVYSALTKFVSIAVGLVSDKVGDYIKNQLKDIGVVQESLEDKIVRDLNDIKSKFESLSLKDLDTSCSFLKEGVQLLNLAIGSANKDKNESPPDEASRISKDRASDVLKEAPLLRKAIQGLNISSKERFLSAKGRFEDSRKEATRAFNNKSLGTANRIMACKLRVAVSILESGLEDPQAAVAACLVSLKELHGLPQIQDMLLVFLKGGFKSRLKTEERLENIMSVLFINHALFDFAFNYSSEYPNVFTWPGITLKDSEFNPILDAHEIIEKTWSSEEFSRPLSRIVFDWRILEHHVTLNSRSEAVVLLDNCIKFINSAGVCISFMLPEIVASIAIAIDCNDNVYVVGRCRGCDENRFKNFGVLRSFDKNYKLRLETTMDFLVTKSSMFVKIAVDKNGNIIVIQSGNNRVYICNSKGQLKFEFKRDSSLAYSLCTTGNNDVMIPSDDHCSVHVYTTEGNLKSTIETPEGHEIAKVAFHHGICKIIIVTYSRQLGRHSLLCYSETGELEHSQVFNEQDLFCQMDIAGHFSGPFVVHWRDSVIFI